MDDQEDSGFSGADSTSDGCARNEETEDVYAQLAQKERDLMLAAELGKALLDSNQELQSRHGHMVEEFTLKFENLQQEKYDLQLEMEKLDTEQQNVVKDLHDEITSLRGQLHAKAHNNHSNQAELTRSLQGAQQKSDYLAEQVRLASKREEELLQEIAVERTQSESSLAVAEDHVEHIKMLREEVDYLTSQLKEKSQSLLGVEHDRDLLTQTVENAQDKLQALDDLLREKDIQIQRQVAAIEELTRENKELKKQLARPPSLGRQFIFHNARNLNGNNCIGRNLNSNSNSSRGLNSNNNSSCQPSCQGSLVPMGSVDKVGPVTLLEPEPVDSQLEPKDSQLEPMDSQGQPGPKELCLASADTMHGYSGLPNQTLSLASEFSSTPCFGHRRNQSDCSVSSAAEGSRKRHHHNVGSDTEDEEDGKTGQACKHSFLPQLMKGRQDGGVPLAENPEPSGDKQPFQSEAEPSGDKHPFSEPTGDKQPFRSEKEPTEDKQPFRSETEPSGDKQPFSEPTQDKQPFWSGAEPSGDKHPFPPEDAGQGWTDAEVMASSPRLCPSSSFPESEKMSGLSLCEGAERSQLSFPGHQETSLYEELSGHFGQPPPSEPDLDQPSLYQELSTQLREEEANGTARQSDYFSGSDWLDSVDSLDSQLRPGSAGREQKHSSSDSSFNHDWPYTSCAQAEMLEEDDFECDDDDFLVGNIAGSTLSIGERGMMGVSHSSFHTCWDSSTLDRSCDQAGDFVGREEFAWSSQDKEAVREACLELRDLVVRLKGPAVNWTSEHPDLWSDKCVSQQLVRLVQEMKICVDSLDQAKVAPKPSYWLCQESSKLTSIRPASMGNRPDRPELKRWQSAASLPLRLSL